jgi:thiol-disulfide isomerase/thioredoxin
MLLKRLRLRLCTSLLALAAVLLAGCGTSGGSAADAPETTAPEIPGLASCAELSQEAPAADSTADHLPPLQLPCLTSGPTIDLSALAGGPVLINLWASWCGPCRQEMPLLQAAHESYGEQVAFLGVDTEDTTDAAASLLGDLGITYPQVVDVEGDLLAHLGPPGLPVTVVLDGDGRVAATHIGQLDTAGIEDLLAPLVP